MDANAIAGPVEGAWPEVAAAAEPRPAAADRRSLLELLGRPSVVGPAAFAVGAVSLLLYDHLQHQVPVVVFWLALALIVAVFAWMLQTARSSAADAAGRDREARCDPLTGLDNRLCLEEDIEAALRDGSRRGLLLFELEGLQHYNASHGVAAGDDLMRRTGLVLREWASPLGGGVYRIEGSRLATLVPLADGELGEAVLAATAALHGHDRELRLARSHGEVSIPAEAGDPETALQLAEGRLALHRQRQHHSAQRQAHAVLMAVLAARRPERREHLLEVAYRAISIARRLGLPQEELDEIALAAELQGVGLLTVPEAVLEKEGPLSEEERALIQAHPLAGERIIGAAPSLAPVAVLVRSSAEHFDGSGQPDGLAGAEIPLGSRIVAVAVAFEALGAPRPYREAADTEEALRELRRCAGSQFDPRVVEALAADLTEELAELPAVPAR